MENTQIKEIKLAYITDNSSGLVTLQLRELQGRGK